jgi:hypothetical protein
MIKPFFALLSAMLLLVLGILLHAVSVDRSSQATTLSNLVAVTGMISPALSVAYYEPRIYIQDRAVNPAYPQMPPMDRMDFIYAE